MTGMGKPHSKIHYLPRFSTTASLLERNWAWLTAPATDLHCEPSHMSQHMREQTHEEAWNALHTEINPRCLVPLMMNMSTLWGHCTEKNQRQNKTDVSLLEVTLKSGVKWRTGLLPFHQVFIIRPFSEYFGKNSFPLHPESSKQLPPSKYLCAIACKKKKTLLWSLIFPNLLII